MGGARTETGTTVISPAATVTRRGLSFSQVAAPRAREPARPYVDPSVSIVFPATGSSATLSALRVGLLPADQLSQLKDYQERRRFLLSEPPSALKPQVITSLAQFDWAIRAAVLQNDLLPRERDLLEVADGSASGFGQLIGTGLCPELGGNASRRFTA